MKRFLVLIAVFVLTIAALALTGCSVSGKSDGTLEGSASIDYPSFMAAESRPAGQ